MFATNLQLGATNPLDATNPTNAMLGPVTCCVPVEHTLYFLLLKMCIATIVYGIFIFQYLIAYSMRPNTRLLYKAWKRGRIYSHLILLFESSPV